MSLVQLADRYMSLWRQGAEPSPAAPNSDLSLLFTGHNAADYIRSCERNETFYQMLDVDSEYHLNQLEVRIMMRCYNIQHFLRFLTMTW